MAAGEALDREHFAGPEVADLRPYLTNIFGEPEVEVVHGQLDGMRLAQSDLCNEGLFSHALADRADYNLPYPVVGVCEGVLAGYVLPEQELETRTDFVCAVLEKMTAGSFDRTNAEVAIADLAARGEVVPNAIKFGMFGEVAHPGM